MAIDLKQFEGHTFQEFSAMNRARCEAPDGFNHKLSAWSTGDWFMAVLGELGEAANIGKKLNRVRDGIPGNKETADELRNKFRQELGDTFVYLDLIAQAHGFLIGDAALEVFNAKSSEIGYATQAKLTAPTLLRELAQAREQLAKLTDKEFVGRIMHESWSRTKRAQGFHGPEDTCTWRGPEDEACQVQRYVPGRGFTHCEKFHADLIPWEELPEAQKDINRHAFDAVLAALGAGGTEGGNG